MEKNELMRKPNLRHLVSFRVTDGMLATLEDLCRDKRTDRSQVVRELIENALKGSMSPERQDRSNEA